MLPVILFPAPDSSPGRLRYACDRRTSSFTGQGETLFSLFSLLKLKDQFLGYPKKENEDKKKEPDLGVQRALTRSALAGWNFSFCTFSISFSILPCLPDLESEEEVPFLCLGGVFVFTVFAQFLAALGAIYLPPFQNL
ncbi:MAG TPA: hypothetical protein VIL66_08070 [Bacillota bacterium]